MMDHPNLCSVGIIFDVVVFSFMIQIIILIVVATTNKYLRLSMMISMSLSVSLIAAAALFSVFSSDPPPKQAFQPNFSDENNDDVSRFSMSSAQEHRNIK